MSEKVLKNVVGLVTETGRPKTEVAKKYKKDIQERYLPDFEEKPNGEFVLDLVQSHGQIIKAVVQLVITTRDNFEKAEKKSKGKKTEPIDIPDLFE